MRKRASWGRADAGRTKRQGPVRPCRIRTKQPMPAPAPRLAPRARARRLGGRVDGVVGFGRGCRLRPAAPRVAPGSSDRPGPSILIRPMWTSVDSRLAAGSPACSPWCGCTDRSSCRSDGRRSALAVTLDGPNAPANQMLGFRGGDDGVEVPIPGSSTGPASAATVQERNESPAFGVTSLPTIEIADAAGDQLVLLDRSQFGPVDQFGLEQSRLEGRGGLTLCSPLSRMYASPHRSPGEIAPAGAAWDRQRRCSAERASWPRHPRP